MRNSNTIDAICNTIINISHWTMYKESQGQKIGYLKPQWIAAGYIPISKELSFQRTFAYFPFFVSGNMMRGTDFAGWAKRQNKYLCGIILLYMHNFKVVRWMTCPLK